MVFRTGLSAVMFQLWVILSVVITFTVLIWQPSTGARQNLFDVWVTLPSLVLLAPSLLKSGALRVRALIPLWGFIALVLLSMLWADQPDVSKTLRGAVQVLALFIFFTYLFRNDEELLLRRSLLVACVSTALFCFWHLWSLFGLSGILFSLPVGQSPLTAINTMHITLLVAPQVALLLGLVLYESHRLLWILGMVGLVILVLYLVALGQRTGLVVLFVTGLMCLLLFRNRLWLGIFAALLATGAVLYVLYPELFLSRGLSWRPQIWMSTLEKIASAPWLGHGVSNRVEVMQVLGEAGNKLGEFRHPHNMALTVTYSLGVVGLLLWLLLWLPGLLQRLFVRVAPGASAYQVLFMAAGSAALLLDGGEVLSPLHYYWFCFWVPALLMLASQSRVPKGSEPV